jgi:hypothetical protein
VADVMRSGAGCAASAKQAKQNAATDLAIGFTCSPRNYGCPGSDLDFLAVPPSEKIEI